MIPERRNILAAVETVQGSDAAPTPAANAIKVEGPKFAWIDTQTHAPKYAKPTFGPDREYYGGGLGQLTFRCYLKGSGAAGTPPEIDPLLQACRFGVTNVPATSDTYTRATTGHKFVTIYFEKDGKLYKMLGGAGNFSFAGEGGQAAALDFTFIGHVAKPTDSALQVPTFDAVDPPVFVNASFLVDSYAAVISALTFDLANVIAKPRDVNSPDGFGDLVQKPGELTGSFNPLETLVATYDWEGNWQSDTLAALATGVIGSVAGNRWQITMPKIQYRPPADADNDGVSAFDIGFKATEDAGDDEITIAYT